MTAVDECYNSYFKISSYTGVNSKFYGIRVAKKLIYCSPSAYDSLWGAKPPLPCSSRDIDVISPNLWHGRVPRNIPSPLKPPFSPFLSAIGLSCVIATIRGFVFLVFSCDCFPLYLSLFCFFVIFCQNGRLFCISEKYLPVNRNFKNLNFRNISTFLRSTFLLLRPLVVFFCPTGRLCCANLAEWHVYANATTRDLKKLTLITENLTSNNAMTGFYKNPWIIFLNPLLLLL